jgi:hypothetical protein
MTRPLHDVERALLLRILEKDGPDIETARKQVERAHHSGPSCAGGDMCFDLEIEGDVPLIDERVQNGPVFGALVYSGSDCIGTVDLWVSEGRLASLEYSWFTDDAPTALPSVDQIRHVEPPRRSAGKHWFRRTT